ncbi:MAG: ferrous iron transport protein B [Acidobacteria bacterium]|nr:ferrous iron transport protein B [Acidobacteriota bacterium]
MADKSFVIAVAGNPNSGKTSLFNRLTGSNLKVGNWPGVTVEKKEGEICRADISFTFVDIPGTYGLSARSEDERIAMDFLTKARPDAVIVVLDSANFNRNFYLFTLIMEMGLKVIPVLNMTDMAEKRGITLHTDRLAAIFGIPFVKTIASRGKGISALWKVLEGVGELRKPVHLPVYPEPVETAVQVLMERFPKEASSRFRALGVLDGGIVIPGNDELRKTVARFQGEIEEELQGEPDELIAEKRYEFVYSVAKECVERRMSTEQKVALTDRIDRFVTNRYLGGPLFLFAMWLLFFLVFTVGNPFADWINRGFGVLSSFVPGSGLFASFIREGLIAGVGAVLVFVPNIFILFFLIAIMEDSGYLSRAAFVADRFMHALGLHGKSFIPMLLGFGCNIPAVMAVRTLENEKDRVLTALAIPYMSCSARLPVYLLFVGIFFTRYQSTVVFSLYLLGIFIAVLVARTLRRIFFTKAVSPLVMELPAYHVPSVKTAAHSAGIRTLFFIRKAGTFIFGSVMVIWVLASLPLGVPYASAQSIIGRIGSAVAPVFHPAGFDSWQAAVALIFGFLAKEVVVGTFGVLYGGQAALSSAIGAHFSALSAMSFMVMTLIYIPCVATIAVIRREIGTKWAALSVGISVTLGYGLAVVVFQVGKALGMG